jgi:hypothetical protein
MLRRIGRYIQLVVMFDGLSDQDQLAHFARCLANDLGGEKFLISHFTVKDLQTHLSTLLHNLSVKAARDGHKEQADIFEARADAACNCQKLDQNFRLCLAHEITAIYRDPTMIV